MTMYRRCDWCDEPATHCFMQPYHVDAFGIERITSDHACLKHAYIYWPEVLAYDLAMAAERDAVWHHYDYLANTDSIIAATKSFNRIEV